jgi:hypothetical protein
MRSPLRAAPRQLISRLLKGRCELCERPENVQVHHVGQLADLDKPQLAWAQVMAKIRQGSRGLRGLPQSNPVLATNARGTGKPRSPLVGR